MATATIQRPCGLRGYRVPELESFNDIACYASLLRVFLLASHPAAVSSTLVSSSPAAVSFGSASCIPSGFFHFRFLIPAAVSFPVNSLCLNENEDAGDVVRSLTKSGQDQFLCKSVHENQSPTLSIEPDGEGNRALSIRSRAPSIISVNSPCLHVNQNIFPLA